mmetsp:Transcript_34066/g.81192  ORF Transcript_34066/g.81192 Transcript_34066/m.81192 type:complete len:82 (+) Transcript_34066:1453-1698(+)
MAPTAWPTLHASAVVPGTVVVTMIAVLFVINAGNAELDGTRALVVEGVGVGVAVDDAPAVLVAALVAALVVVVLVVAAFVV